MLTATVVTTIAACAAMSVLARRWQGGWAARGITSVLPWSRLSGLQMACAVGVSVVAHGQVGPAAATAAGAFTWVAVLAVSTDLASHKMPREVAHPAAAVGLAALVASGPGPWAWLSLAFSLVALVAVPYLARALTRNGLGLSDVRLLWAATATLSWWAGQDAMIYGLVGACLLQVVVRVATRHRQAPEALDRPRPRPRDLATVRDALSPSRPPSAVDAPTTSGAIDDGPSRRRGRRELPFAPALVAGLALATVWAVVVGATACASWGPTGAC